MASRGLLQFLSCSRRTAAVRAGVCRFSSTGLSQETSQTAHVGVGEERGSPWTLMAAVCLQRLPMITSDRQPLEERFNLFMNKIELENSAMSDHELRLLNEAEKLRKKQANEYDSDDEYFGGQSIMLAQDLEDAWDLKLKSFQPVPRVRADIDKDLTSAQRCLDSQLIFVVEQQVGDEMIWMLPQKEWRKGETLRYTAQRALNALSASGFKTTILSNTPCGVYKYKLPKALRTERSLGRKIFFFKAILSGRRLPTVTNPSHLWLKKSELPNYLKPEYLVKVNRFLIEL